VAAATAAAEAEAQQQTTLTQSRPERIALRLRKQGHTSKLRVTKR